MNSSGPSDFRQKKGDWAEDRALEYLKQLGYLEVTRKFRAGSGEVDLILEKEEALVFVEVRFRESDAFMDPLESISPSKQSRIKSAAGIFYNFEWNKESLCQFDVVVVLGTAENYQIRHYAEAFR